MKRSIIGATLALLAAAPAAQAACTSEQLQAKAAAYSKRIQDVIAKDHTKAQAFTAKLQEASQKLQEAMKQPGAGMDEVCQFYDKLLAELEGS